MADRAPEEIIRDWLADHGPTRVKIDAFEQTWGIDRMGPRDRRRVAAALASVGVTCDPPLAHMSRDEQVLIAVEEVVAEPEPEPGPEPEPEPEPEPDKN